MKKTNFIFIILVFAFLQGCGDLNDGPGTIAPVTDSRIPKCIPDEEAFHYILEKNIVKDIDCIYEQLEFFMGLAIEEGEDEITPTTVKKATLKDFVKKKMNNDGRSEILLKHFDLIFDANGLIFGSPNDELNLSDIEKLKEFVKYFNTRIVAIERLFHKLRPGTVLPYSSHRNNKKMIMDTIDFLLRKATFKKEVVGKDNKKTIEEIDVSLLTILKIRPDADPKPVSIAQLIRAFQSADYDNSDFIESLVSSRFLKPVFLGGSDDFLSRKELISLANGKLEPMMSAFYDLYRHSHIAYDSSNISEGFKVYSEHLKELKNTFLYRTPQEIGTGEDDDSRLVIHIDKIFDFLKIFGDDFFGDGFSIEDVLKFRWEALRAKEILLGNNSPGFSLGDMKNLIGKVEDITDLGYNFSTLFKLNEKLILEGDPITNNTPLKGLGNARYDDFKHILKTHRYFTGNRELPVFGHKFDRNVEGLIELSIYEKVLTYIVDFIENEYPCDGGRLEDKEYWSSSFEVYNSYTQKKERVLLEDGYTCINEDSPKEDYKHTLTAGQIVLTLKEFRRVFNDLGIITKGDEYNSASSVVSLADLFSYTSNDNQLVEVSELSELFMNIFNSNGLKDRLTKEILRICKTPVDYISKDVKEVDVFNTKEEILLKNDDKFAFHPGAVGGGSRYDTTCVRDNFYQLIKKNFRTDNGTFYRYFDYLPKMERHYKTIERDKDAQRRMILLLEKHTKACSQDNVPYSASDVMALFAGIFNIESTIAKFDLDDDNIISTKEYIKLDNGEVVSENELAYRHFKPGVQKLIPGKIFQSIATRKVFNFIVKYRKPPLISLGGVIKIIGAGQESIDRETLASVLVSLNTANTANTIETAKNIGLNFVSKKTQCKFRLPLDQRKAPIDERLVCNEWGRYLPDMPRDDCDLPVQFSEIQVDEDEVMEESRK